MRILPDSDPTWIFLWALKKYVVKYGRYRYYTGTIEYFVESLINSKDPDPDPSGQSITDPQQIWQQTGAYLGFCQGGCPFLADLPPPPRIWIWIRIRIKILSWIRIRLRIRIKTMRIHSLGPFIFVCVYACQHAIADSQRLTEMQQPSEHFVCGSAGCRELLVSQQHRRVSNPIEWYVHQTPSVFLYIMILPHLFS